MFDDDSIARAKEEAAEMERRLLAWLDRLRQQGAAGKLLRLDQLLGRPAGGHLTKVIAGEKEIYLGRFLFAVALLRGKWRDLLASLELPEPIPEAPPDGYLWRFREPRKSLDQLDYLGTLTKWLGTVHVDDEAGQDIALDIELVRSTMNENRNAAHDSADALLRAVIAARPERITRATAHRLLHLLGLLADLYRLAGLRTLALVLFERAFAFERRARDLAGRSYLYRTAAYLFSDLGELDEGYLFADRAVRIALATKRCEGLGPSMYVRAVMVDRRGDYEAAGQLYEGALTQVGDTVSGFRSAVYIAAAYAYLQADRDREATVALDRAWELVGDGGGLDAARIRSVGGELASRRGDSETADSLFAEARQLCKAHGTPSDIVVGELLCARHLLRTHDVERARECLRRVSDVASRIDGPVGEAAVLQLRLELSRGVLTNEVLVRTVRRLEQPWRYIKSRTR